MFQFNIPHKTYRTNTIFHLKFKVIFNRNQYCADEFWKRWTLKELRCPQSYWFWDSSVVSQEQGENHFWDKRKHFDLGSESAWTLEVSVPPTTKSERKPKPAWPFSNLAPLNKKRWDDDKLLSPLLSERLFRSRLLSPLLSSRLHSIT